MSSATEKQSSISLRSVGVVTFLSVGQLVLLFGLQLVVAHAFGASDELDAYLAAYALPLVVGGILAGAIGSVVIPIYNEQRAAHGADVAERELARTGLLLAGLSTAMALAIALLSNQLIGLFYAEFDAPAAESAAGLLQILAWLVPLNTLTGFLYGAYHSRHQFFLPAFAGLFGPASSILLFLFVFDATTRGLAWAILAGGGIGTLMLMSGFPRARGMFSVPSRPTLHRLMILATPLLLGAACSRLDVLVDRPLAARLSEGSISHMGYAWRIATAVATLATSGLAVVIFPSLARHAADGDMQQLRSDLTEGWRLLVVVLMPVLGGLLFCSDSIIEVLFRRGEFTSQDVHAVAGLVRFYLGVILAAGVGELASRTFFSLGRTWVPTLIGLSGLLWGSVLKFVVVDTYGAAGLVGVTSLYYVVNTIVMIGLLGAIGIIGWPAGLLPALFRSLAAAALAIAPAWWLMQTVTPARVTAGVLLAAGLYPAVLYLAGDEYPRRAVAAAASYLPGRSK
ncbi:Lipid II flippase MurJ [Maioricimonas rarisocia]|uniref:Lipid II flippase MurJ n=1 Tax=Maioricimonas rarisocia TaxID=2528026 RepID=A0A517Z7V5_9PLAN|nr:lipid II flippase MurJ [Maioricimonas rarisocia]QDU38529.1 Lipid II flippase MurJ [Maioricimonas rarisocia]